MNLKSIFTKFIFIIIIFILGSCKKDGSDNPTKPLDETIVPTGATKLNGKINSNEIGGSNLVITTSYQEGSQVYNGQFSIIVSNTGNQLVFIVDSDQKLRGLTLSIIKKGTLNKTEKSNESMDIPEMLEASGESTTLSLLFLTPGISTLNYNEPDAIDRLKKLWNYNDLKSYITNNLKSKSLEDLVKEKITQDKIGLCVDEYRTKYKNSLLLEKLSMNNLVDPSMFDIQRVSTSELELRNYGWRYVDVYRCDLDKDNKEIKLDLVIQTMDGVENISLGSIFTLQVSKPIVKRISHIANQYVLKSEYWIVGLGIQKANYSIHPNISNSILSNTNLCTICNYFILPILDIVIGEFINSEDLKLFFTTFKSTSAFLTLLNDPKPEVIIAKLTDITHEIIGIIVDESKSGKLGTTVAKKALGIANKAIGISNLLIAGTYLVGTQSYAKFEIPADNSFPPNPPSNPKPDDKAQNQPTNVTLTWDCSHPNNYKTTYDLLYGIRLYGTINLSNKVENLQYKTYTLSNLSPNATYDWKIIAKDDKGKSTDGPVWSFTTTQSAVQIPVLTTAAVTNITQTTANSGGNISSDGGSIVTARGVCWSTGSTPTIANSKTTDGTGIGSFTSNITGLTTNTTYYVRAYATNSAGTGYGSAVSFTTQSVVQIPVLTTAAVTNITQTTATCGGNITSDGGATITARGVCWSTSSSPTIANSKTTDGTGTGSFTSNITGLIANTTYYVRAYATNNAGTGYGNTVSFTTPSGTGGTVTDIDGNVYHTVTIGTQIWMVENLKTTKYRNGDAIPNVTDNTAWYKLTTGAYCNYDNNTSNATTYGRLYNWYAVNDSRKIAPAGWHVATDAEWTTLTTYLGGSGVAGGKLKETGTAHWASPNTGATNETGFTALPGGFRNSESAESGSFDGIGRYGDWWSSTEHYQFYAWERWVAYDNIYLGWYDPPMQCGFSVRCVRD